MGRGAFYYVTLGAGLCVLALSANTSFAGFPCLCRLIAEDDYLPHAFANRGQRLVYTLGLLLLTTLSAGLLIAFGGITDRLIPLFAIGAFGAFTLSQAGMIVHWRRAASKEGAGVRLSMLVNGVGAAATAPALVVVRATKFLNGAWVTLRLIGSLLTLFDRVHLHYAHVSQETCALGPLDSRRREPPMGAVPIKG